MAYDGLYADLSTRGTTNEILTEVREVQTEVTQSESNVAALTVTATEKAALAEGSAAIALINAGLANNAASNATAAADAAALAQSQVVANTGRFLSPKASNPTVRDNGSSLQTGDRYLNTTNNIEYIYDLGLWSPNNLDGANIANASDTSKGVALVGFDNTTLYNAMVDLKTFSDYTDFRAYTGIARTAFVRKLGLCGQFIRAGSRTNNDGISITDGLGRIWTRLISTKIQASWFDVDDADATAGLQRYWSYLVEVGGSGEIPSRPAPYYISNSIAVQLNKSFESYAGAAAEFVATSSFPSGVAMFQISNSVNVGMSFKWIGGRFDGSLQPWTDVGSGSGCAMISVNASSCNNCHIEIDRTYSGPNWLDSGGDSHLFIGGPKNIYARIYECIGAWDSGIYISRNFAGTQGEVLDVGGNFYNCAVGIIIKRQFTTASVDATGVDCINVAAVGQADIQTAPSSGGGSGYRFYVNAKRCENPVFLQAVRGVQGTVMLDRMGVYIAPFTKRDGSSSPGYSSTDASGVRFRGARDCQFTVDISGVNTSLTNNTNFVGAFFGPITNAVDGTLQAVDNVVNLHASGIGSPYREETASDNNFIYGELTGLLSNNPTRVGANTRHQWKIGTVEFTNLEQRLNDNSNNLVYARNADGSIGIGNRASAATAYVDFFSAGNTTRSARISSTGGTGVAENGILSLSCGQVTLNAAATDTQTIRPATAGVGTVGQNARPYNTGFVQTAFTVTSDGDYKDDVEDIPDDVLDAWQQVEYKGYVLKDAKELKGDQARRHFGVIAQQVRDSFLSKGLDPFHYGLLCYDEWDAEEDAYDDFGNLIRPALEAGKRYSVRYEEALCLEMALMRRTLRRLEEKLG